MSLAGSGEELITACAKKSCSKAFYAENSRSILSQKNAGVGLSLEKFFFFETSSRPFIFNGRHSTRFHMVAADIYNTQSSQVSQTRMEVGSHKKETRAMQATFY